MMISVGVNKVNVSTTLYTVKVRLITYSLVCRLN